MSKYLQRDVEIGRQTLRDLSNINLAFDSVDKQGGFIGAMYVGTTNVAVEVVREG